MAAPTIQTITSLSEYAEFVDARQTAADAPVWYRGVGSVNYQLIPSLYRHPTKIVMEELVELEGDLLTRFRHRCIPFYDRPINDPWELLFLMQHFGVPTRLLDWSENPFIALYFAVTGAETKLIGGDFRGDAAVWLLDTKKWNGKVLSPYWKGKILAIPDNPTEAYTPGIDLAKLAAYPVAIAGLHNSSRIVAQRGAFTIFGHANSSMEQIFDDQAFPADSLAKIVLPQANLSEIRKSLFGLGYCDSSVYPDLSGLATELKRHFCFEA